MTTILPACYCCKDPIFPEERHYTACFDGGIRIVCEDCALGIHYGTQIFQQHGVTTESQPRKTDDAK
jgi:hypothetical protein